MAYVIYTVQADDRIRGLHGLARWLYGKAERRVDLYSANRSVIGDDPLALRPGQQLVVPYDPDQNRLRATLYEVQADDLRELPGRQAGVRRARRGRVRPPAPEARARQSKVLVVGQYGTAGNAASQLPPGFANVNMLALCS